MYRVERYVSILVTLVILPATNQKNSHIRAAWCEIPSTSVIFFLNIGWLIVFFCRFPLNIGWLIDFERQKKHKIVVDSTIC